jgi:hypothetical protein
LGYSLRCAPLLQGMRWLAVPEEVRRGSRAASGEAAAGSRPRQASRQRNSLPPVEPRRGCKPRSSSPGSWVGRGGSPSSAGAGRALEPAPRHPPAPGQQEPAEAVREETRRAWGVGAPGSASSLRLVSSEAPRPAAAAAAAAPNEPDPRRPRTPKRPLAAKSSAGAAVGPGTAPLCASGQVRGGGGLLCRRGKEK